MLRKLEEKDVEYMLEWMHDPEVTKNFQADFLSMTKERVLNFVQNSFSEETQHFAFVNEQDEYLGTISLKHISEDSHNAEYAIVTRVCAQGTGAAKKATYELLEYAFEELKLHKVYLNVIATNERARALYEKCGFKYEGLAREHFYIQGEYRDMCWYGITVDDYRKNNA